MASWFVHCACRALGQGNLSASQRNEVIHKVLRHSIQACGVRHNLVRCRVVSWQSAVAVIITADVFLFSTALDIGFVVLAVTLAQVLLGSRRYYHDVHQVPSMTAAACVPVQCRCAVVRNNKSSNDRTRLSLARVVWCHCCAGLITRAGSPAFG